MNAAKIDRTTANATNSNATNSNVANTVSKETMPAENLNLLKDSKGKTASDIKLWENKEMNSRFEKLLGADFAAMEKNWNTEIPLEIEGGITMLTGCENDNCSANQYVVFADTAKNNLNVYHLQNGKLKVYKEKEEIVLPKDFAADFAIMKRNANIK